MTENEEKEKGEQQILDVARELVMIKDAAIQSVGLLRAIQDEMTSEKIDFTKISPEVFRQVLEKAKSIYIGDKISAQRGHGAPPSSDSSDRQHADRELNNDVGSITEKQSKAVFAITHHKVGNKWKLREDAPKLPCGSIEDMSMREASDFITKYGKR